MACNFSKGYEVAPMTKGVWFWHLSLAALHTNKRPRAHLAVTAGQPCAQACLIFFPLNGPCDVLMSLKFPNTKLSHPTAQFLEGRHRRQTMAGGLCCLPVPTGTHGCPCETAHKNSRPPRHSPLLRVLPKAVLVLSVCMGSISSMSPLLGRSHQGQRAERPADLCAVWRALQRSPPRPASGVAHPRSSLCTFKDHTHCVTFWATSSAWACPC